MKSVGLMPTKAAITGFVRKLVKIHQPLPPVQRSRLHFETTDLSNCFIGCDQISFLNNNMKALYMTAMWSELKTHKRVFFYKLTH